MTDVARPQEAVELVVVPPADQTADHGEPLGVPQRESGACSDGGVPAAGGWILPPPAPVQRRRAGGAPIIALVVVLAALGAGIG